MSTGMVHHVVASPILSVSVCPSVCVSVCASVYLSVCPLPSPSLSLYVSVALCLSLLVSVFLSLSVRQSPPSPPLSLSLPLSLHQYIFISAVNHSVHTCRDNNGNTAGMPEYKSVLCAFATITEWWHMPSSGRSLGPKRK